MAVHKKKYFQPILRDKLTLNDTSDSYMIDLVQSTGVTNCIRSQFTGFLSYTLNKDISVSKHRHQSG